MDWGSRIAGSFMLSGGFGKSEAYVDAKGKECWGGADVGTCMHSCMHLRTFQILTLVVQM